MKIARITVLFFTALVVSMSVPYSSQAEEFRIAIMQDAAGAAKKYGAILVYLKKHGIDAKFVPTYSYPGAAKMFAAGKVDAMFSGSGVAACMMIKDVAYPLVRPVNKNGWSTYWAVVLARKGAPQYTHDPEYFSRKKVAFTSLASSGEFFYHAVTGKRDIGAKIIKTASHEEAIELLSEGEADIAIVKNRVWKTLGKYYPKIAQVGQDSGQNPNGTLILSKTVNKSFAKKLKSIFLAFKYDTSKEATDVRRKMKVREYIETTEENFKTTIAMLIKAGVDKDFDFEF